MTSRSYELQILDLFRSHFFGSRRGSKVDITAVSPNQAFILSELVRREFPSLEDLRSVLKLHVSSLSRAISQLNKVGMVKSARDPRDSRRARFKPTPKGIAFAESSWRSQQAIISERLKGFRSSERMTLERFLRAFVGEEAYRRVVPIANEPEMAIISRALTYDHGVVSDNYLDSGYSVLDWILLSEIHFEKRAPSELAQLTRTPPSTISIRLKSLQRKGLLSVARGVKDKRARELWLSTKGLKELESIEGAASRYFARTLRTMPEPQIEEGISLFERYVNELRPELKLNLQIKRVPSSSLEALRRQALVKLAQLGEGYPLGAILLHPQNEVYAVSLHSKEILLIECDG